VLTLHNHQS